MVDLDLTIREEPSDRCNFQQLRWKQAQGTLIQFAEAIVVPKQLGADVMSVRYRMKQCSGDRGPWVEIDYSIIPTVTVVAAIFNICPSESNQSTVSLGQSASGSVSAIRASFESGDFM